MITFSVHALRVTNVITLLSNISRRAGGAGSGQSANQKAAASLAQAEGQATQVRVQQQANLRAQIYAVLTPQQQVQAVTLKAQEQARRAQWKEFKEQNPAPASSVQ